MRELQGERLGSRNSGLKRDQLAKRAGVPLVGSWPLIRRSAYKACSQQLAWGTPEEDHIPCWANAVATLDSFTTMDEGIAPWGEEGLT